MVHRAIYGGTVTGKTWLAKSVSHSLAAARQIIIVYSGCGDIYTVPKGTSAADKTRYWPPGALCTDDAQQLEDWLGDPENFGAHVFIDEASVLDDDVRGRAKAFPVLARFGQKGRHKGYTAYFITQYPTGLERRTRVNCPSAYVFRLGDLESGKLVCRDYGLTMEYAAKFSTLAQLHFYDIAPGKAPILRKLA